MSESNDIESELPLFDALDSEILMHREAHFAGKFDFMIDYYKKGGKGIQEDFDIERIQYLADLERQMNQNLAPLVLTGPDAEKIFLVREAYKKLRNLYEGKTTKQKIPKLIADLILSESEEEAAIQAVANEKETIVPALINLLRSEDFHDPLFPGYGLSPGLAVRSLERIGDKRAIIALFEAIGQEDFFGDEFILKALKAIGEPAKTFLLRVLKGKPLNEDNERAAMSLVAFKDDQEVAEEALKMLQDKSIMKDIPLATYLIVICEGLKDPAQRKVFERLADSPETPQDLLLDIRTIANDWNQG